MKLEIRYDHISHYTQLLLDVQMYYCTYTVPYIQNMQPLDRKHTLTLKCACKFKYLMFQRPTLIWFTFIYTKVFFF